MRRSRLHQPSTPPSPQSPATPHRHRRPTPLRHALLCYLIPFLSMIRVW
uniref:Uncharacterized protein n=1 Tax=Arundo donax TaxID=35708 RepID=A0A0A9G4U1_ARUDO